MNVIIKIGVLGILLLALPMTVYAVTPTSMSVQGRLTDSFGDPLTAASRLFMFKIFDSEAAGTEIWSGETQFVTSDDAGLWHAQVGAVTPLTGPVFSDSVRWLEITVFLGVQQVTLPRVRLMTSPYAFQSLRADTAQYVANGGGNDDDWLVTDTILFTKEFRGIARGAAGNEHSGDSAHTIINLGVMSATGGSSATIGGGRHNRAHGAYSVVSGGGGPDAVDSNSAMEDHSTVGGGRRNVAGRGATVSGGVLNEASRLYGTVGGGYSNKATDSMATVAGGFFNEANGFVATVGGGAFNTSEDSMSTVAGGFQNMANGRFASIGGGSNNRAHGAFSVVSGGGGPDAVDSNSALEDHSTIGGGRRNVAGRGATVSGGVLNEASTLYGTVGGGYSNKATDSMATVAGGFFNEANGFMATVGGGANNKSEDSMSTVAGGSQNTANGRFASVGGGSNNRAHGVYSVVSGGGGPDAVDSNSAMEDHSTIGGGRRNVAMRGATVSGGVLNAASSLYGTVGGGYSNKATDSMATVAGGFFNEANGFMATVGGGAFNTSEDSMSTVAGGFENTANGRFASVGGGQRNNAEGKSSAIAGGEDNDAIGELSLASGHRAKAMHNGSFVWADAQEFDFESQLENQFTARATGGISFVVAVDGDGNPTWTAELTDGGSWAYTSDSTLKENFEPVDGSELLRKLAELPITSWNSKSQEDEVRRIGPMAQDFHAAFGLGRSDRHIASSDVNGIALAAIQELDKRTRKIESLESELAELRRMVQELSERTAPE